MAARRLRPGRTRSPTSVSISWNCSITSTSSGRRCAASRWAAWWRCGWRRTTLSASIGWCWRARRRTCRRPRRGTSGPCWCAPRARACCWRRCSAGGSPRSTSPGTRIRGHAGGDARGRRSGRLRVVLRGHRRHGPPTGPRGRRGADPRHRGRRRSGHATGRRHWRCTRRSPARPSRSWPVPPISPTSSGPSASPPRCPTTSLGPVAERGGRMRRAVLGDAHVERSESTTTACRRRSSTSSRATRGARSGPAPASTAPRDRA